MGCVSEIEEMKYPETKQDNIEEYIFGENIEDPYRWLEDFTSKETLAWVEEQNNLTDSFITNDYQKKIKKDLEEIWSKHDI